VLISFCLRKGFRPDIAPNSLIVVLQQPYKGDGSWKKNRKHHADIGVWWVNHSNLTRTPNKVEPVILSESDAQFHGIEEEIIYPVRLTDPRSKSSLLQQFQFICYGWNNDVYMPHSTIERFNLTEHGGKDGSSWSLAYQHVNHILPNFYPDADPMTMLNCAKVLKS
jgi:hypothetical protein